MKQAIGMTCLWLLLALCCSLPGPAKANTTGMPAGDAEAAPPPAAAASAVNTALPAPEAAEPESPPAPPGPPRARLDPDDDAARSDLWQRVRDGFAMPDLEQPLVRNWEQYYATRGDYLKRMTDRGARYLFHIVEELQRREMPMELALLPFVESAFDPQAMSRARASGMWQFMPATGKDFELRQNVFRDDRRDVLASTRAALDYLQKLNKMFGNWQLALAAYNWGQGNVRRAIEANQRAGLGTGYTQLKMPDETRNYLPKLQAMKNLIARPADFGFALTPLANHPYFVSVAIDHDIDVALVAKLSGLELDAFHQLNPQLNKPVILAAGTPQVLLPYDNANLFVQGLSEHRGSRASWTAWVAPRTLKPAEAAKIVGMPETQLREVNRIPDRMLVQVGSTLLVPRAAHSTANVSEHIADNATVAFSPEARPLRRFTVRAGKHGDTVSALAKRYGIKPEQLAALNGVAANARFAPGHVVKVAVPQGVAKAATRSTAKASSGSNKPVAGKAKTQRKAAAKSRRR
jgi:membrane-bound lytic murein transglycosylase D